MPVSVEVVNEARAELGEGPLWDDRARRLIWVDYPSQQVLWCSPPTDLASRSLMMPGRPGCVGLRQDGGILVALPDGVWALPAGAEDGSAAMRIAAVPGAHSDIHLNDGACDPTGRFWVGSVVNRGREATGVLWRLEPGGELTPTLSGLQLSNGMDWSSDGRTFYHVDSLARRVDMFSVDLDEGTLRDRRPLVDLGAEDVLPDGLTIDSAGCIWVALWGGWAVRRYTPDGRLDQTIRLPVAQVSSCTFGGPAYEDLYITTAREGLSDGDLATQPLAGGLFCCRPGAQGRPAHRFGG